MQQITTSAHLQASHAFSFSFFFSKLLLDLGGGQRCIFGIQSSNMKNFLDILNYSQKIVKKFLPLP